MISKVKFQEFIDINGLDTITLDQYGDTLTTEEAYKELGYFQGLWSDLVDHVTGNEEEEDDNMAADQYKSETHGY